MSCTRLGLPKGHAAGAAVLCRRGMLFSNIEKKYG